jgi:hypothetical protein
MLATAKREFIETFVLVNGIDRNQVGDLPLREAGGENSERGGGSPAMVPGRTPETPSLRKWIASGLHADVMSRRNRLNRFLFGSAGSLLELPDFGHVRGNALGVLAFPGTIAALGLGNVMVFRHL